MNYWIYFATAEMASRESTFDTAITYHFLWRSALKRNGHTISRVREIKQGDHIIIAWRQNRIAYVDCTVAAPRLPVRPELVIDKLRGSDAQILISAGYPKNSAGEVEGIRIDNIRECEFRLQGEYGGQNAIHKIAEQDASQISIAAAIPREKTLKQAKQDSKVRNTSVSAVVRTNPTVSAVDQVEVKAISDTRAFDAYVMVDWSSCASPATGNDSIWIARGAWLSRTFTAGPPQNVSTRVQAIDTLRNQLLLWRKEGKRVLIGFDFAFGYPAGFARALGLTSPGGAWKAVHEYFASSVNDSAKNKHNRDSFAAECNRRIGAPGPFWGCTASAVTHSLTLKRVFQFPHHGLEEWRATEIAARRRLTTQPVWKLNSGPSVGGQTIMGIKHLHELAISVDSHIWPFEGWRTPDGPSIWFAEIFPSIVRYSEWADEYRTRRDRTQVQSCVRYAAEQDSAGLLTADFAKPATLDSAALAKVEEEEGWILWV